MLSMALGDSYLHDTPKRGTTKHYVYTIPSTKAIQKVKDKVKAKTYRSTRHWDLNRMITSLNRSLVGWANYFRHGVSKAVFSTVDHHAWLRLMRWTRAKHKGRNRLGMRQFHRRFCDQGWRIAHNGVAFTGASSVPVTNPSPSPPRSNQPIIPAAASSHQVDDARVNA